jgi:Flp pilus assembly protein TadB
VGGWATSRTHREDTQPHCSVTRPGRSQCDECDEQKKTQRQVRRNQDQAWAQSRSVHLPSVAKAGQADASGDNAMTSIIWRKARRVVVLVVGGTLLLLGIALLVLPGPAFIVIPAGLAILAIEFRWARRWLRKARSLLQPAEQGDGHDCPHSQPPRGRRDQPGFNASQRSTTSNPLSK